MSKKNNQENKILIMTADEMEGVRSASGVLAKRVEIDADLLGNNITVFLGKMNDVMAEAPDNVGPFKLSEVEVSAQITGKGQVVLWGIGGEVSGEGGIKFVFKK